MKAARLKRMFSNFGSSFGALMVGAAFFPLVSCAPFGMNKDESLPLGINPAAMLGRTEALTKFRALIASAKCATCHDTRVPQIGSPSVDTANGEIISYVDVNNPAMSKIVKKAVDGHCGGSCVIKPEKEWASLAAQLAAAIKSGAGTGGGERGRFFTTVQNFAYTTSTTPTTSTWDLGTISGNFSGAVISFRIVYDPALFKGYRISSLKLTSNSSTAIALGNIKIIQNDQYDPGIHGAYTDVSAVVPVSAAPLLTPAPMIIQQNDGGERFQISFEKLEASSAMSCQNLAGFQANVLPRMQAVCFGCHTQNGNTAQTAFNMAGADEVLCANSLLRTDRNNAAQSALIIYPYNGYLGHPNRGPNVGGLNPTDLSNFTSWISSEYSGR